MRHIWRFVPFRVSSAKSVTAVTAEGKPPSPKNGKNPYVTAFAKNDRLDFGVRYKFEGVPHYYHPGFLVKLDNGITLVLETKGRNNPQAQAKHKALDEWIAAVIGIKECGEWHSDISFNIADVDGLLQRMLKIRYSMTAGKYD